MKRRIRLSESKLHRIIKETVLRVLNENDDAFEGTEMGMPKMRSYFNSQPKRKLGYGMSSPSYLLNYYSSTLGNGSMLIEHPSEAQPYIKQSYYWDITNGSNSSEIENLVAWGGVDGYWYNVLHSGYTEITPRERKYILSKEVKSW